LRPDHPPQACARGRQLVFGRAESRMRINEFRREASVLTAIPIVGLGKLVNTLPQRFSRCGFELSAESFK